MTSTKVPGQMDPGFNDGKVQYITPAGPANQLYSLLALPDGRMLIASNGVSPTNNFLVNLFNADGSLPSIDEFGNVRGPRDNGYLVDSFGALRPTPQLQPYNEGQFHVLSYQSTGIHFLRYNASGERQQELPHVVGFSALPAGAVARGPMFSAAHGELLYAAFTVTLLNADTLVAVMCFTADGVLNPAFNGTGVQLIHVPDTVTRASELRDLGIQRHGANAGKVVIVGGWSAGASEEGLYVTRLTSNGETDLPFGEDGFAWVAADRYTHMQLVVDPADTLKVCGSLRDREAVPKTREVAIAWSADGEVDLAFNGGTTLLETTLSSASETRGRVFFSSGEQTGTYRLACQKRFGTRNILMAALDGNGRMDELMGRVRLDMPVAATNGSGGALTHTVDGKMLAGWGMYVFRVLGE